MAHSLRALLKLTLPKFYPEFSTAKCLCSAYNKFPLDTTKQAIAATDILMLNLKNAKSTSGVLEMVKLHDKIMNKNHVMQALRSLFLLQRQKSADLSPQQILKHPLFERLCSNLKTKAGAIDIHETIEALKIVVYLGVRSDSTIVQALLQLIRHNINDLNLHNIMFLDFLFTQTKTTPMMEALRMALPLVFEIHCVKKMDRENIDHLAEYLYYASRHDLSETCIYNITNAILECRMPMTVAAAKSIIWSASSLPEYEFLAPVLKIALDTMTLHIDELEFEDLETTLTKLLQRSSKHNYFFDETFIDTCVNYIIDKEKTYSETYHIMKKLAIANYYSRHLADYISAKIHEDPNLLANGDSLQIYTLVKYLSLTDHRPVHWDEIRHILCNMKFIRFAERREILWLRLTSSLCLLDIFDVDTLKRCFEEHYLVQLFKRNLIVDQLMYLAICQSLRLKKPELLHLIPDTLRPQDIVSKMKKPNEYPLEASLHTAFGGNKYVGTGLLSKVGALIDHLVVFRNGGYPVALNPERVEYIEDMNLSPDHNMVLILGLTENDFTMNSKIMKSYTSLRIQCLEAEGYSVAAIDLDLWSSMPDFERIPYLVQTIKTKSTVDFTQSVNIGLGMK